jgi:hypothetical protein
MNQPKIQEDIVPQEGASPAANPEGRTPMGIPEEITKGDPAGDPTGDRLATEVAVLKIEQDGQLPGNND